MVQKNVVTPRSSKVASPAPTRTPWLLTGLILMGLNAYFPQLSPVSSLWSPLRAAIPVAHWMASWWFVAPGWELNLVSLAPLSHTSLAKAPKNRRVKRKRRRNKFPFIEQTTGE
ncbi:hypothetical protein DSO57_1000061 [Entomophthora muscae]|uniref:Uncharacterized protein n=1 Tax=Entomophthora muscae TaxID=34485 RepID=A0ACC2SM43_9FUNG|nr:hypothetical protein DSO57_1000061 [Entomophthora muscae]